jgi:hypothetical protein
MPDTNNIRLCAGGCGETIPADSRNGFKHGHRNGCPTTPPQQGARQT